MPPALLRARAWWPVLLFVAIAASRLPFLDAGYGTNYDAWRVAGAARHIAETGEYEASRLPGYPVHEIVCSWFWKGGPLALNGLSAAFSVAAAMAVWSILRELKCRDSSLITAAFAATPVVFINSASSKDYVWAIAFVLWAFYAAMRRRPLLAGVMLGLAIGCRITSGAMLLPLAMIVFGVTDRGRRKLALLHAFAAAGVTAVLAFLPVWGRYGFDFFNYFHSHDRPSVGAIFTRATVETWGTIGTIGVLLAAVAGILFACRRPPVSLPPSANRWFVPAIISSVALCLTSFNALPDQAGYLIPLVPGVLFLLARFAPRPAFQAACVCLLIAPWIEFSGGKPAPGAVLADHAERVNTLRDIRRFVGLTDEHLPGENTVVVGAWEPIISVLFPTPRGHNHYVYLLSAADAEGELKKQRNLAYASEVVRGFNYRVAGIDLATYGARNIRQMLVKQP